jgi:hypothetical protein
MTDKRTPGQRRDCLLTAHALSPAPGQDSDDHMRLGHAGECRTKVPGR